MSNHLAWYEREESAWKIMGTVFSRGTLYLQNHYFSNLSVLIRNYDQYQNSKSKSWKEKETLAKCMFLNFDSCIREKGIPNRKRKLSWTIMIVVPLCVHETW